MKPSKKNVGANATKTQVNDKLAPGIETFFKSAPKSFVVAAQAKPDDGDMQFFVEVLKEKLRRARGEDCVSDDENGNELCQFGGAEGLDKEYFIQKEAQLGGQAAESSVECAGCAQKSIAIDELESKCTQQMQQHKELKKVYVNLTISFSELQSKYNDLLKAAASASANHQTSGDGATSISGDDFFTQNEIKFLQCMPLDRKNDCTFIHHCLKYAYKQDPSVLVSKTLKGTAERTEISGDGEEIHHSAKDPITPQKAERIKGLFMDRISKCPINSVDYSERIKDANVNRLIAAGIKNLSKKFKV